MTGPALWCVERDRSGVFLFGETLGLRPGGDWLRPAIRDAVETSRDLWREADREELSASPLLADYALADEPLSARFGAAAAGQVRDAARLVGIDPDTLEGLRPWVAGQVLEGALREQAGLDAGLGVDAVIAGLAAAAGVPMRSELGDAAATFGWFDALGPELGVHLWWTVGAPGARPGGDGAAGAPTSPVRATSSTSWREPAWTRPELVSVPGAGGRHEIEEAGR